MCAGASMVTLPLGMSRQEDPLRVGISKIPIMEKQNTWLVDFSLCLPNIPLCSPISQSGLCDQP